MSRYLLPRLQDFVFIIVFVGALLTGPRMLNTDGDLGRHLTVGNYILDRHHIPTTNLFSFTKPNQPRPPYEWLAQVLFSISYRLLNLDGVVLLTAFVISAVFLIVYFDSAERSSLPMLALILTLWAATASSLDWLTRPHIFSFLFLAIWIRWLEKLRNTGKIALWFFPVLMLVWANTHGGFISGILAWIAYLGGWLWDSLRKSADMNHGKKLMIIGSSSLIASILTPDLWRNWQGVFNNNSIYILSHTTETMPVNFAIPGTFPFAVLLALSLGLLLWGRKQIPMSHIFLLLGFAVISLLMVRNIPFFAITATPILTGYIGKSSDRISLWRNLEERVIAINKRLGGYLWPILIPLSIIGIFSIYQFETHNSFNQFSTQVFPVRAVNWIENHPLKGNMFNEFNWGGYILYRLWPGQRVFIDSQSDFYGEVLTRQYSEILNGDGNWDGELRQYDISWIIVSPQTGLARATSANLNWQLAYRDPITVIYVRK
jgi:hypothetical protein